METENEGKNRGGRPKKLNKKAFVFSIRISKEEQFVLKEKAKQAGCSLSNYIRQAAINGKIIPRLTREERIIYRQLVGMAHNLNQLTKAYHQEGIVKTALQIEGMRNQMHVLLIQFKT